MGNRLTRIACIGDSITAGNPGVSYVQYLKQRKCKKHGIGGDTILGLSNRINSIVKKDSYSTYIIEIGANDILLPFLLKYSESWQKAVKKIIARGIIPSSNVDNFIAEYQRLLIYLQNFKIKIIAVSIPCLGEKLEGELNLKVNEYNRCIKKLCKELNVVYVDFNAWQKETIEKYYIGSAYFIYRNFYKIMVDSLITTLGFSKYISSKRNLIVTIDGVHLNHIGARALANLIDESIKGFTLDFT
jgi:lysophospholipase L1-like esterase